MKPTVKLIGTDGNVFNIIAKVSKALKSDEQSDVAKRFTDEVLSCKSYHDVLKLASEFVEIE